MRLPLSKFTIDEFVAKSIERYGDNPCIGFAGDEPITYRQMSERILQVKEILRDLGIRKGNKVLLLGENSPNWAAAFLGIMAHGAIVVPVLPDFPEADINHIIRHSEAVAAFLSPSIYESLDLTPLESIRAVHSLADFSRVHERRKKPRKAGKKQMPPVTLRADEPIEEDDLAEILYTSGTTGHSKGVMLTHKNIVSNAIAGADTVKGVDENSVVLTLLPMAHSYGSTCTLLGNFYCGAVLYFLTRKPSPKVLVDAMQKVRPTTLTGVPLVFEKVYHKRVLPQISQKPFLRWLMKIRAGRRFIYRRAGKKIMEMFGGRLECAVIGGAALNPEVETFLRDGGIPYTVGYGLSECSPLVSAAPVAETKFGSVGRPIEGVQVKIAEVEPDTGVGEILVKGPNVMRGYYKNPEANEKVFTKDGWLITGDRGVLDKDGFLFIRGRSKNVIVGPSGENIYPEIIEEILKQSPYVEEALVYAEDGRLVARVYPDYDYMEEVHGDSDEQKIQKEITSILEEVRREANQKLPAFSQISRIIQQTEPFEKTPTNKIKRALYVPGYLNGNTQ